VRAPTYPYFGLEEYRRRLRDLRGRLAGRGVDALVVHTPENIYYLTGYQSPGYYWYQALVVPLDREPVLIPPPHEASLVEAFAWVEDYRLYQDRDDPIAVTRTLLEDLGLGRRTIALELGSWFLTSRGARALVDGLPDARIVDGTGVVEEGRLIKSPEELGYVRQAARIAEAGMAAGIDAVRAGATEAEVAVEAHRAQLLAGGEYTGLPMFVTSGVRSLLVHATWSPKTLASGEMVFLEVPGCLARYHAAMTRAVHVGAPPPAVRHAAEVNAEALRRGKAAMRPGVPAAAVFEVVREAIDRADVGYRQGRRAGYGIGIAFPPGWDEGHIMSINGNETRPLQAGMVFHLITTMRIPGIGAIGCSDTVLVTADGCETLTGAPEPGLIAR
jgi:Xaa-Pro dipeptidase